MYAVAFSFVFLVFMGPFVTIQTLTCAQKRARIGLNHLHRTKQKINEYKRQESPAIADKPARRLRKVCTVYVRALGL